MAKIKSQHWLVVLLMTSGIALCALILALEELTLERIDRQAELYTLTQEAALQIAEMHLWFEEAVVSDTNSVDIDTDVWGPLDDVVKRVQAKSEELSPGAVRDDMVQLGVRLTALREALYARWRKKEAAGSESDEAFDVKYRQCLALFGAIGDSTQRESVEERGMLVSIGRLVVVLVFLLFAFLSFLIHQNRRAAELRAQELEQRVQQRTSELVEVNHDLEVARDRAEDASRAKSQFLANMSHEIRTPLNAVIGTVSLLLDSQLPSDQRQALMTIQSSGKALLALLSDVLDFSRVEVGRVELEQQDFDVVDVIDNVLWLFVEQASQKGIELVFERDSQLPRHVNGDGGRLRQVMVNLVSNAVKFTSAGEVIVGCHVRFARDSKVALEFSVEDTGIGIPEDKQATLFEPFTQADSSHTRVYGGSGLGLAICKELVQLMGGELSLESEPGRGARFKFTLHFEDRPESVLDADSEGFLEKRPARALLVEDNERVRGALRRDLEHFGCEVVAVPSLALAEQYCREREFDALFLDVGMVTEDALEFPNEQTVYLFAMGNPHEHRRIERLETCNVLAKPVSRRQLRHSLRSLMSGEPMLHPVPVRRVDRELRVLVAEDNRVNQELVVAMLRRQGCQVTVVGNGREAVEQVASHDFDLVLMDCQMPELDGYQATGKIRELGARGRLPIVALTAHAMRGDRERALAAGMDDYLAKPFETEDLSLVLGRWSSRFVVTESAPASGDSADLSEGVPALGSSAASTSGESKDLETVRYASDSELLLDESTLERLSSIQNSEDFVQQLIDIFLAETPELLQSLEKAWHASDAEEVRQVAHRLRSSCSNLGALRLAADLRTLETETANGILKSGLMERCQQSYADVREAMSRHIDGLRRSD